MLFCLLAILSFAVQNICIKEYGNRFPQKVFSQSVMVVIACAIVAAIMAALGGMKPLTGNGYIIAAVFGAFFTMTIMSMAPAMFYGHLGLTVLIQNSSLLVPVVWGVLFWGEELTVLKVIGIILILILLVLSAFSGGEEGGSSHWNRKKWIFYLTLCFIGDSALSVLQGMMSRECATTDSVTFTFWTSIFSICAALILMLISAMRKDTQKIIEPAKTGSGAAPFALSLLGIGAGTAGGNCLSILALTVLPSVVLFPVRMGGLILVMWLLGVLLYREKVTKSGLIMLVVGLTGIVLLNL